MFALPLVVVGVAAVAAEKDGQLYLFLGGETERSLDAQWSPVRREVRKALASFQCLLKDSCCRIEPVFRRGKQQPSSSRADTKRKEESQAINFVNNLSTLLSREGMFHLRVIILAATTRRLDYFISPLSYRVTRQNQEIRLLLNGLKMFPSEDIFVCQQKRDEQPVS
jgi:hypothetical protein